VVDRGAENCLVVQHALNRVGATLAFVGPLVGVLVAAHGGGDVRGAKGSRWPWVAGKWPKNGWKIYRKICSSRGCSSARLIVEGGLSTFLSPFWLNLGKT